MVHAGALLPGGREVPFSDITAVLAGLCDRAGRPVHARALTATLVVVGPDERLAAAAEALLALGEAGTVRGILISTGSEAAPPVSIAGNTIALSGIKPAYVDNAVAALRLSSLPTLVWWRGGSPELLDALARLADRVVLDDYQPDSIWKHALSLFETGAFSDLRWTRLTRWRALMAHFFDVPEVIEAAPAFTRLRISGTDPVAAQLYAGWLTSSRDWENALRVELRNSTRGAPLAEVRLMGRDQRLILRLAASRTCVLTRALVHGHPRTSRTVSLGDQSLAALITEELRLRARDAAFERALRARPTGNG